jgi:hypothetical protein
LVRWHLMQPDQVTEGEYRVITHPRPEVAIGTTANLHHSGRAKTKQ